MTSERALSAALDLAAGAAAVLSVRDLDAVVWPPLAALVGSDGLAVTGFDGAALSWPPGRRPSGRHQMAAVLGHGLARARVALVRADRAFSDRDLALLGLVRPHLADALWRAAHEPEPCPLTARQRAVLAGVAQGATNRAIAHDLGISRRTVGKHLENAYAALGVHDRTSAALLVGEASP